MTKENIQFAKFLVLVNGLVPGTLLAWDWANHHVGTDPTNYVLHTTGMLALIFLMLSLLVTPLRQVTGIGWLFYFRRSLGLFAFYYALAHFAVFVVFDRNWDLLSIFHEMTRREYLIYGSLAFLLLLPLALTSTNAMIKRLGSTRWRRLHKLVYVAAILAVIHFGKQGKGADYRLPMAFTAVLFLLLGFRVGAYFFARAKRPAAAI